MILGEKNLMVDVLDKEHMGAVQWSRITEAQDQAAAKFINAYGYAQSWQLVQADKRPGDVVQVKDWQRWRNRLAYITDFDFSLLDKLGISILIPTDTNWPVLLDDLGLNKPLVLWVRGNPKVLSQPGISIVGSRLTSTYGEKIALDFAYDLSAHYVIVSGGAYGIDTQAHNGALLADNPTVIVSAGGVDNFYPVRNTKMYQQTLAKGGAVISESPLGSTPQRYRFLSRNRIIAALTKATLVVEAGTRSGALNTAHHALELGREVGAIPGDIFAPTSIGTNELIRNGATLVTSVRQVRELVEPLGENLLPFEFTQPSIEAGKRVESMGVCNRESSNWGQQVEPQQKQRMVSLGEDEACERIWDVLSLYKYMETPHIAALAGYDVAVTLQKLGKLLLDKRVIQLNGLWKKCRDSV